VPVNPNPPPGSEKGDLRDKAYNNLGLALDMNQDKKGALRSFRTAVNLNPALADAYVNMGDTLEGEAALNAFRMGMKLDPSHAGAYSNLANNQREKPKEATELYHIALKLEPDSARMQYNAATVYGEANLYSDQQKHLEIAHRLWGAKWMVTGAGVASCPGGFGHITRHWCDAKSVELRALDDAWMTTKPGEVYGHVAMKGEPTPGPGYPWESYFYAERRMWHVLIRGAYLEGGLELTSSDYYPDSELILSLTQNIIAMLKGAQVQCMMAAMSFSQPLVTSHRSMNRGYRRLAYPS